MAGSLFNSLSLQLCRFDLQRLMKMNMPVCGDNTVLFRATLFCLVRASLHMTPKDKKCFRDSSFRKIIRRLWPNTHQKTLDVILPEQSGKVDGTGTKINNFFTHVPHKTRCSLPPSLPQIRNSTNTEWSFLL